MHSPFGEAFLVSTFLCWSGVRGIERSSTTFWNLCTQHQKHTENRQTIQQLLWHPLLLIHSTLCDFVTTLHAEPVIFRMSTPSDFTFASECATLVEHVSWMKTQTPESKEKEKLLFNCVSFARNTAGLVTCRLAPTHLRNVQLHGQTENRNKIDDNWPSMLHAKFSWCYSWCYVANFLWDSVKKCCLHRLLNTRHCQNRMSPWTEYSTAPDFWSSPRPEMLCKVVVFSLICEYTWLNPCALELHSFAPSMSRLNLVL